MAEKDAEGKIPFTLHLTEDLAKRLHLAAASRNRAASDVAAELLDRHLPPLEGRQPKKKGGIPYA